MARLRAVKCLRELRGKSRPRLMLLSDGKHYAVKFKKRKEDGLSAPFKDYLAALLARELKTPVPRGRLVHIGAPFIVRRLPEFRRVILSGNHFASRYVPGSIPLRALPGLRRRQLLNPEAFAQMVVFDHWIGNLDRNGRHILLKPRGRFYQVYLIDHGFSFKETPLRRPIPRRIYRQCAALIAGPKEIHKAVERVLGLSEQRLRALIDCLPYDWMMERGRKKALIRYLAQRSRALPGVLTRFCSGYV